MKFNDESRKLFLEDKPFYENNECFCLGNSLEEAGEIIKRIVKAKNKESDDDVGMATS